MATTTISSTVSVTAQLGDTVFNFTKETLVSSITQIDNRRVTVPTTVQDLLKVGATIDAGQFVKVDYLVICNHDATNFVTIGVKDTGGKTAYFRLDAGEVFLLGNTKVDANITGAAVAAFSDWDTITAQADTLACDVEYLAGQIA